MTPTRKPKNEVFICEKCFLEFPTQPGLKEHSLKHWQPPIECVAAGCERTFDTVVRLNSHMRTVHIQSSFGPKVKCKKCESAYRNIFSFVAHYYWNHVKNTPEVPNSPFSKSGYLQAPTHAHPSQFGPQYQNSNLNPFYNPMPSFLKTVIVKGVQNPGPFVHKLVPVSQSTQNPEPISPVAQIPPSLVFSSSVLQTSDSFPAVNLGEIHNSENPTPIPLLSRAQSSAEETSDVPVNAPCLSPQNFHPISIPVTPSRELPSSSSAHQPSPMPQNPPILSPTLLQATTPSQNPVKSQRLILPIPVPLIPVKTSSTVPINSNILKIFHD